MTELLERLVADVGGRYMVERELGRGGMATVYLARDLMDETQVAIKVMDPELAAAVGADRFKREIGVASRLQHPNILGIISSGEAAGTSYYVMPFVKGETLRDRLDREKQLPIEDAIRIAREVADALDYAHKQGVVHRDIKPENILLEDGRAMVADFGIARAASEGDAKTLTKTGVALGTPHYMSPEQIFAEKDIDGRTDQYALACMLHEMLAGQPPFVGPHAQSLMAQHALDEPPLVSRFRPSTPPNVEDAILTGLAKQRADRFQTLGDFRQALENSGYTSLMKVTRLQRTATAAQLEAMQKPKPVPLWKKVAVVAGGIVLGAGALGGLYAFVGKDRSGQASVAQRAEMKRVAVLYFQADARGDLPALADGLTEGLIAQLRGVKELTVRSKDGVQQYRGKADDPAAIAAALDVGTLVTGSVDQQGDQLVVSVRLLDKSGETIDRFPVTQPAAESYALRDKVAAEVAQRLRSRIGKEIGDVAARAGTQNQQAWTLFQRGERARRIADSLTQARQLDAAATSFAEADRQLREAASLDAKWGAPLVSLANVALTRAEEARDVKVAAPFLDSAEALAGRALDVQHDDAEAFAARGAARAARVLRELVSDAELDARFEQAAADLDTATTLDPTLARAYNMRGRLEYAMKRPDKAKIFSLQAYQADAFLAEAPNILYRLFITSHDVNSYEDAEKYCNEGARRFPSNPMFIQCRLMVRMMEGADSVTPARIWRVVDSLKAAVPAAAWDRGMRRESEMFAAVGLIRAGLRDSAERVLERAVPTNPRVEDPEGELMGLEAFVRTQLGQKDEAIRLIERYVGEHPQHIVGFRRADFWWWRPLVTDPRFKDILALARARR